LALAFLFREYNRLYLPPRISVYEIYSRSKIKGFKNFHTGHLSLCPPPEVTASNVLMPKKCWRQKLIVQDEDWQLDHVSAHSRPSGVLLYTSRPIELEFLEWTLTTVLLQLSGAVISEAKDENNSPNLFAPLNVVLRSAAQASPRKLLEMKTLSYILDLLSDSLHF
jgi:hypothetical protein